MIVDQNSKCDNCKNSRSCAGLDEFLVHEADFKRLCFSLQYLSTLKVRKCYVKLHLCKESECGIIKNLTPLWLRYDRTDT